MSRDWKPGTVLLCRDEISLVTSSSPKDGPDINLFVETARGRCLLLAEVPDTTRPLVVIDPEDPEQVERLLAGYHQWKWEGVDAKGASIADMQDALREFANPTPPKPDEPKGLGAVVITAKGTRYVVDYVDCDGNPRWYGPVTDDPDSDTYGRPEWSQINAVQVLSEGDSSMHQRYVANTYPRRSE